MNPRLCITYIAIVTTLCLFNFPAIVQANAKSDAIEPFTKWLDDNSGFTGVRKFRFQSVVSSTAGSVGDIRVVASQPIKKGEVVYTVKSKLGLSNSVSPTDSTLHPIAQLSFENDLAISYDNMLRLRLITEAANPSSFWAPYLDILPKTLHMPHLWTKDEIEELQGTSIYVPSLRLNATVEHEYRSLFTSNNLTTKHADLFPESTFTRSAFWWAYSIVRSRNFREADNKLAIFPLTEFFNFARKSDVSVELVYNVSHGEEPHVLLRAIRDIAAEEEITINDKVMNNGDLLTWYGIVLPQDLDESFPVALALDTSDQLYGFKRSLFAQNNLDDDAMFLLKYNYIPPQLIFALRVYHLTMFDYDMAESALQGDQVSSQNELAAYDQLAELCDIVLQSFKTSAKEDKKLLEGPLQRHLYSAVVVRKSERRVIKSIIKLVEDRLEYIRAHWHVRSMETAGIKVNPM